MQMMPRLVVFATVLLLLIPQTASTQDQGADTYKQVKLFGDVFERVRADYVEEVSDQELIEAAIRGMLASLDPHSSYLDPKSFQDMRVQTKGEFGGLGIEVTMENGLVKVVSPIDDTPAFRAGVQAGDLISHLDGEPVLGLTLAEAVERMRGPVNTDLVLTLRRANREPFDVTITRDIITVKSVRSRLEDDVGYLRVTAFNEQTSPGLEDAVTRLSEQADGSLKGYVLDLRNNPGGLLDQAIAVSDAFLDHGEIVSTRGRHPDDAQRYNAREGDLAAGLPIVVLINGGSASASEIVAGALQDHGRAIIMGTRSFGKGSVQTIIPLSGSGAMRLTTSRYYTPSGSSIQAHGIDPDIEVEQARLEPLEAGVSRREEDLRGALSNESSEEEGGGQDGAAGEEEPEDYQLSRAIDLLQGLSLFRERALN
jgi:carboxyl-terminal processing protease